MKRLIFPLFTCLLLVSCAGTEANRTATAESVRGFGTEEALYDVEWMQRYEGASRRGGARVYWVNKPRRDRAD